jgi:hypothetical protein
MRIFILSRYARIAVLVMLITGVALLFESGWNSKPISTGYMYPKQYSSDFSKINQVYASKGSDKSYTARPSTPPASSTLTEGDTPAYGSDRPIIFCPEHSMSNDYLPCGCRGADLHPINCIAQ